MPYKVKLPESLLRFIACRPGAILKKITSEASVRNFYRISRGSKTLVAMVYPEPCAAEVQRFQAVQKIYRAHGLRVPRIDAVLDDQVVIQEDAGDLLLQRAWHDGGPGERLRLIGRCREILAVLAAVPPALATARLDRARLKWEMDFFLKHFFPQYHPRAIAKADVRSGLFRLVEAIDAENKFAHRDFHSRNLLVLGKELVMVDFQDSLVAPRYYDLVSLAFDSYLDLGMARGRLFPNLAACGHDRELRQIRLTALQRNIKALGTFAYQTHACKHRVYSRYIPRTIRHVRNHLLALTDPELEVLSRYFMSLLQGRV